MQVSSNPTSKPTLSLNIPDAIRRGLADAVERGKAVAADWIAAHPAGNDAQFAAHLVQVIGSPPGAAATRRELDQLHSIAAQRTVDHNAQAVWLDAYGLFDVWDPEIASWKAQAGPDQAGRGQALLDRARAVTKQVTFDAKDGYGRQRPFLVDPSLRVVDGMKHSTGASYPSGHASNAYVTAGVLRHLAPERQEPVDHVASQVSFSRNYAGVHFPSDVVSGALIGAAAAEYAARRMT